MAVYFINIIFTIIDCVLMAYIYKKSGPTHPTNKWIVLVIICLLLRYPAFISILENLDLREPVNLISSLLIYIFVGILMKVEKSSIILWPCVFLSIALVSENIAGLIQQSLSDQHWFPTSATSITQYFSGSLLSSVLRVILISIIFSMLSHKQLEQIPKLPDKMVMMLSIIPISSIIVLCTITLWWHSRFSLPIFGVLGIDFGVLAMTIFNLFMFKLIQIRIIELSQKQASEVVVKKEIQFFTDLENKEKNIRMMCHDLKNQYLILAGYIEDKNYDAALNYINKSIIKLDHSQIKFYTNNPILNYLLNQKAQQAIENNIQMKIKAFIPADFHIESSIIASILGNLIDNALNACIRQKDFERKISILLKLSNNNLIINIDNTFDRGEIYTRRWRMKGGIGLKSVQSIVSEQNGLYKHWIEGETYHASVVLMKIYEGETKENDEKFEKSSFESDQESSIESGDL
ncbi:GHKL domain-containing protein [Enterococcus durans]|uniref:GHKL domain-containing protein n=1 Tax=Enterococcus durans TaxID=53345 RepID=UPI00164B360C|nr:GHKL domain-containing protein [Enterococcus durans]